MLRLLLATSLAILTACASEPPGAGVQVSTQNAAIAVAESPATPESTAASEPSAGAPEKEGLTTGQKVAIGVGSGAIAAVVIYGIIIAVGSAALLASG